MTNDDNLNIKGTFNDALGAMSNSNNIVNTINVDCSEVFPSPKDQKDTFVLYACSENEFKDLIKNRKFIKSQFSERVILARTVLKEDKSLDRYDFEPSDDYKYVQQTATPKGYRSVQLIL